MLYLFLYSASALTQEETKAVSKYNNFISPSSKSYFIQHERDQIFQVKVLYKKEDLAQGFSGINPQQVGNHQGLFFYFPKSSERKFWMPNTLFNLMIIYLDDHLEVKKVIRNAPHHIGYKENTERIYRAPPFVARYVLEFKASSPFLMNIKPGSRFSWVKRHPPGFEQK